MIDFKGHRFEKDIILPCVRWYLAYPLSYRNLEEMLEERGVQVDHTSIYRWVQKFTPQLEATFRNGKKHPVGRSWRMDETYIKIRGQWRYLYRAVDKAGQTIDFLFTAQRDKQAALRFLRQRFATMALPTRSPSTRVAPTPPPLRHSRRKPDRPSRSADTVKLTKISSECSGKVG